MTETVRIYSSGEWSDDCMLLEVLEDRQIPVGKCPSLSDICVRETFRAETLFSIPARDERGRRRHVVASRRAVRLPTRQAFWIEIDRSGELTILEDHQVDPEFLSP